MLLAGEPPGWASLLPPPTGAIPSEATLPLRHPLKLGQSSPLGHSPAPRPRSGQPSQSAHGPQLAQTGCRNPQPQLSTTYPNTAQNQSTPLPVGHIPSPGTALGRKSGSAKADGIHVCPGLEVRGPSPPPASPPECLCRLRAFVCENGRIASARPGGYGEGRSAGPRPRQAGAPRFRPAQARAADAAVLAASRRRGRGRRRRRA